MHYLFWLFAAGCLGGAFYEDAVGTGDFAVLGWFIASIGWALAGFLYMQTEQLSRQWRDTIDRWRATR
jgi:hypothetical protein